MLILPAYAKLNLALDVIARRDDGMHDIDSLIVRVDWHDIVGVALHPAAETDVVLRVTGVASDGVPPGAENLAARAARALLEHAGARVRADVWLEKRLPHAAGLGGGSADAAATLRAVAHLLERRGTHVPPELMERSALALGSDVPVTLASGAHRVRGRGEVLSPVSLAPLHVVVVVAAASSTAATFAALAPGEMSDGSRVAALVERSSGSFDDTAPFGSALEPAACRASAALADALERVRARFREQRWHMTGSGGAVFTAVRDAAGAESLAAQARASGFTARACRTVLAQSPI